jgi:protein TonB
VPPPETSFEAKPSPSATAAAPASPVAAAPGPATPVPPAKTSASDASYASSNRKPPYPRLSRINDEQGTVVLRVLVKADGTAGTVEVKNSSGYPQLDESARSTVQTWRFKPATVDGKPVTEWYQLAIPFTLQNN